MLTRNKAGKIVSKRASARGKKNFASNSTMKAWAEHFSRNGHIHIQTVIKSKKNSPPAGPAGAASHCCHHGIHEAAKLTQPLHCCPILRVLAHPQKHKRRCLYLGINLEL